jgi:hypothetical protein
MVNGTLQKDAVLSDVDYRIIVADAGDASAVEQAVTIFLNVLTTDDEGLATNAHHAEFRAAQYIRSYIEPSYVVDPPFEAWETERHYPRSYPRSGPMP